MISLIRNLQMAMTICSIVQRPAMIMFTFTLAACSDTFNVNMQMENGRTHIYFEQPYLVYGGESFAPCIENVVVVETEIGEPQKWRNLWRLDSINAECRTLKGFYLDAPPTQGFRETAPLRLQQHKLYQIIASARYHRLGFSKKFKLPRSSVGSSV